MARSHNCPKTRTRKQACRVQGAAAGSGGGLTVGSVQYALRGPFPASIHHQSCENQNIHCQLFSFNMSSPQPGVKDGAGFPEDAAVEIDGAVLFGAGYEGMFVHKFSLVSCAVLLLERRALVAAPWYRVYPPVHLPHTHGATNCTIQ